MRLTVVALLLAALVLAPAVGVAGQDVLPLAWGDASSSEYKKHALMANKSTSMPVDVEAAARRSAGKMAPNNRIKWRGAGKQLLANANAADDTMDLNLMQAADLPDADDNIKATVEVESFDLTGSTGEKYMAFLDELDNHVKATAARLLLEHPVLGRQQLRNAPATWLKLTVTGEDNNRVDFFMRSDNLYFSGFKNKQGTLFAFRVQGNQYSMPGARFLSFGGGYPDFFNRNVGARGLARLPINKKEAENHLRILSNYQGGADDALKLPSAFFIFVFAEAERFQWIRNAVFLRWDNVAPQPVDTIVQRPNVLLVDLAVNWRIFSCAILAWSSHGQTDQAWDGNEEARELRRFLVRTAHDALLGVFRWVEFGEKKHCSAEKCTVALFVCLW